MSAFFSLGSHTDNYIDAKDIEHDIFTTKAKGECNKKHVDDFIMLYFTVQTSKSPSSNRNRAVPILLVTAAVYNARANICPFRTMFPSVKQSQTFTLVNHTWTRMSYRVWHRTSPHASYTSLWLQALLSSSGSWKETPNYIEPCPASGRDEEIIYAAAEIIQRRSQVLNPLLTLIYLISRSLTSKVSWLLAGMPGRLLEP